MHQQSSKVPRYATENQKPGKPRGWDNLKSWSLVWYVEKYYWWVEIER